MKRSKLVYDPIDNQTTKYPNLWKRVCTHGQGDVEIHKSEAASREESSYCREGVQLECLQCIGNEVSGSK